MDFFNGSMYLFGGHDKDMLYNDIWRYKIPTFASDRSKWYELVRLWERDIDWLVFHNNRYNHEILKDVYTQICKDEFDSERMVSRSRSWQMGTQGDNTPSGRPNNDHCRLRGLHVHVRLDSLPWYVFQAK